MGNLSNLYISQSFQSLAHLATNTSLVPGTMTQLQDGVGQSLNIYFDGTNISSSGNIYGANITGSGASIDTGSLVSTSSFNAYTSSNDSKVNQLIAATASYAISSSVAAVDAAQQSQINNLIAATGSYLTSSVPLTSLNAFTASQNTKNTTLENVTASLQAYTSSNSSIVNQLVAATGSYATTGSNTFVGAQTIKNSLIIEDPSNSLVYTQIDQNSVNGLFQFYQSSGNGYQFNNTVQINGNLTASLQEGYVWAGGAGNISTLVPTSSFGGSGTIPAGTISSSAQITALGFVSSSITASSLITASVNLNTITFTKGDGTTFPITVNTGSGGGGTTDITSLNAFTASQDTKNSTLANVTSSLNAFTASQETKDLTLASVTSSLNSATASLFTSASLALVTASFSGNTLTFTKGDASTFGVVIPDVSGSAGTTIFEVVYTGQNILKGDPLYISGSQGANPIVYIADAADPNKMPVTFVSNETIAAGNTTEAIVLGLIEGINLTGYVAGQSIYVAEGGGWSANLPTGANSITQLLGVVTKGGSGGKGLVLNPGPAQLPGLDTGKMWVGGSTNQPVEVTSASFASSASFNSYTASNDTKWSTLSNVTSSLIAATGSYATTGSNTFFGNQTIDGSNKIAFSTTPNDVYINSPFNGVVSQGLNIINYSGGTTDILANSNISIQSVNNKVNITGKTGVDVYSNTFISGALNVTGSLTASLQQGYVWVGDASGKTTTVATSSFGGATINTGSFATTGSNVFNGSQIITGSVTSTLDSIFNSVRVGLGGGNVSTNLAIGSASLQSNTGNTSIGIGSDTLAANKSAGNIAIGAGALRNQLFTGNGYNTAIGAGTLGLLGSGSAATSAQLNNNTLIGANTATAMIVGARNTVIGSSAMQTANNTERNTGIGRGVLTSLGTINGSGSVYNTAIGHNALFGLISGSNNIVMHGGSVNGEGFITGSRNIVIGMDSGLPSSMESNTIIGRGITGLTSPLANAVVLADGSGNVLLRRPSLNATTQISSSIDISGSLTVNGSTTMTGSLILSSSNAVELQVIGNSEFTGSARGNVQALSITSNTASMDLNLGNYFTLTLANTATTHITATNIQPGTSATLVITTGTNSSASLAPTLLQPSGSSYSATNGSAKVDVLSLVSVGTTNAYVVSTKNMI